MHRHWNGVAVAALLLAAVLNVVGLAHTQWWSALVVTPKVDYTSSITLWRKTTDKEVKAETSAGGLCSTSDECVGQAWCRIGTGRCWTYGDCQWQNTIKRTESDCSRLPRPQAHQTWDEICDGDSEFGGKAAGCDIVAAIRGLTIAATSLALIASPGAAYVSYAFIVAGVVGLGFACGFSAAVLALVVDLPGAHVGGLGFAAHCCAMALFGVGAAAALRARQEYYMLSREERAGVEVPDASAGDVELTSSTPYTLLGRELHGNTVKASEAGGKPDGGKPTGLGGGRLPSGMVELGVRQSEEEVALAPAEVI